jgi:hypothetical protein
VSQIAVLLGCHSATVRRWISRFNDEGMAGLADRPRSGRPGWRTVPSISTRTIIDGNPRPDADRPEIVPDEREAVV